MRQNPDPFSIPENVSAALSSLVLGLFAITVSMVFYQNFNIDEIYWLHVNSRALFDDFQFNQFHPQCINHITFPIPWLFMPGRAFASLLHPASFAQMRAFGIFYYLSLIGLLSAITILLFNTRRYLLVIATVTAGLTLGVLPYMMVNVRPETQVALGIALLYLLFLLRQKNRLPLGSWPLALLILFICSWFFSLHPKTVLFGPAIAAMVWFLPEKRLVRTVLLVTVIAMTAQCFITWENYMRCPEHPHVNWVHTHHAVQPQQLLNDPADAVRQCLSNLAHIVDHYVSPHMFQDEYKIGGRWMWLPPHRFPDFLVDVITPLICDFVALGAMALLIAFLFARKHLTPQDRQRHWVTGAVGMGLGLFMASKNHGLEYEAGFVWPVFGLLMIYLASVLRSRSSLLLMTSLLILSILSQTVMIRYLWQDVQHWRTDDQPELPWQPVAADANIKKGFTAAAQACHIALDDSSSKLLFDEASYLTLVHTKTPINSVTVQYDQPEGGLKAFLKNQHSSGALLLCVHVSPGLQRDAIRVATHYCCIPKSKIDAWP